MLLFKIILRMLLPRSAFYAFKNYLKARCDLTEKVFNQYKNSNQYKIFMHITNAVVFPFKFLLFTIIVFGRLLIIWCFSQVKYKEILYIYSSFRYVGNEFYLDMTIRNYSVKDSFKRFRLLLKLFIFGREKRKSFGNNNKDKTFFVIRPYYYSKPNEVIAAIPHLLTNYYSVVQYFAYAKANNWLPVVDWEHYSLPHSEELPVNGTKNAWEYYWKQPSGYSLEEVYRSKNVVLGKMNIPAGYLPDLRTPKSNLQGYANNIINRGSRYAKQIEFNDATNAYIKKAKDKLFPKGKKIMGVAVRGTSYQKYKAGHHAAQPELDELISLVKDRYKKWGADYIFFTNEEEETIKTMKAAFGNKLLVLPRKRYKNYHIYSDNKPKPTNEDLNPLYIQGQRYKTNLDYITEMALLSQCNYLLTALSNGVKAALLWNGGSFEKMEIIDKGVYSEEWEKK